MKSKKLKFQTRKSAEFDKKKRFLIFFCSFLLILGAVSAFVLLQAYNFDLSNLFDGRKEETETTASTTAEALAAIPQGNANFLVCCADDDDIRFIAVINADLHKKGLSVCALSPDLKATVEGKDLTLIEHFKKGKGKQLQKAVEAAGNISISRYAISSDSGFVSAINYAGKIELNVAKAIHSVARGFKLDLSAGKQDFNGDNLLKYIRYYGLPGSESLDMQAEIICSMLDRYINGENVKNGDELFSSLINEMSDKSISAHDYYNNKTAIALLAASINKFPARVVQTLSAFRGSGG